MEVYQIVITRKASFYGCALKHTVEVDGVPVGVLKNGETLAAYTTPGPHAVSFIDRGKVQKSISILINPECHALRLFVELYGQHKVRVTQEGCEAQTVATEKVEDYKAYGIDTTRCTRHSAKKRSMDAQAVQAMVCTTLILSIVFGVCYLLFGRSDSNLTKKAVSSQGGNNVTVSAVAPTPTPVVAVPVSAKDLWTAYSDNKVNADNLYKDRLLAVSGTISDIGQDLMTKAPCVSLDTGDSLGIYSIQCFFPKNGDQNDLIAGLKDGDTVTIYGTCSGTPIMQVQLSSCYFVE